MFAHSMQEEFSSLRQLPFQTFFAVIRQIKRRNRNSLLIQPKQTQRFPIAIMFFQLNQVHAWRAACSAVWQKSTIVYVHYTHQQQSSVYQKFWYGPYRYHLGWMHISSKQKNRFNHPKSPPHLSRHFSSLPYNFQRPEQHRLQHTGAFFEVMTQLRPRVECERSLTPCCCLTVRSMV